MLMVSHSKSPDSPLRTAWHFIQFSPISQRKSCWKCANSIEEFACPLTEHQVPAVTSAAAPETGEGPWGCCGTCTAFAGLHWVQLLIDTPSLEGLPFPFSPFGESGHCLPATGSCWCTPCCFSLIAVQVPEESSALK